MTARRYAWVGAVLGVGAPLGQLIVQSLSPRRLRVRDELRQHASRYLYELVGTSLAFGTFGFLLGTRVDRLRALHREQDRLRDEMTAIIAHDLRTPVTALRLQTDGLLRAAAGKEEVAVPRPSLERIQRTTGDLARMISDLTDATRIEAGRLAVEPRAMAVPAQAQEVIERVRALLDAHPVSLEIGGDEPPLVRFDVERFAQVLSNLLENAAKYSEPGTPIEVRVAAAPGGAQLEVEDHGWGIAADELPHLFDRFYQAERARRRRTGLGLGLYIAKGLMDAQGGRIAVRSQPGRGSTFALWFPATRDGTPPA